MSVLSPPKSHAPGVPPGPPTRPTDASQDRPRRPSALPRDDVVQMLLAGGSALAAVLAMRLLFDWNGVLGTVIWWYVCFLVALYLLVRDTATPEVASDRLATVLIWSVAALVVGALGWIVVYLFIKGFGLLRPRFFTSDLSNVGPLNPEAGGALHGIIGTLEQVGLATAAVVPVAILTAVYLHEIKGRLAPVVRFIVDAMSGLPSIVAGLLVYTLWVRSHDFSGAAAAAGLAILMLPTVTRASEEILRTVPDSLREGSLALGAPQWRVVYRIVLPTARAGLLTAVILGVARAVGETAVLILTALGSDTTNTNPFSGPQSSLPLFIYKLYRLPNQTQVARAWTGGLLLVLLILLLFVIARAIAKHGDTSRKGKR